MNTNARMLPTRSNEDQLDKLRELLRDVSRILLKTIYFSFARTNFLNER